MQQNTVYSNLSTAQHVSGGLINAWYCRYTYMSSWWRVKYHPKHIEQLTDINKLYSVASCWIIIAILYDARSTEHEILIFTTRNNSLSMIFENLQLILTLMALSVSVSAHCMLTAVTQSKSPVVLSYMIYCVSLQNVKAVGNGKLNSLCHQQDQVLKARVK